MTSQWISASQCPYFNTQEAKFDFEMQVCGVKIRIHTCILRYVRETKKVMQSCTDVWVEEEERIYEESE